MSFPERIPSRSNGTFRTVEGQMVHGTRTLRLPRYSADPDVAQSVEGDLIWQNGAGAVKLFDGTAWQLVGGGGGGDANAQWSRYTVAEAADQVEYGAQYTSIQSAVDAAVADGASTTDPRVVLIAPGTYVENVEAAEGVHFRGMTTASALNAPGVFPTPVNPFPTLVGTLTFDVQPAGGVLISSIVVDTLRIAPTGDVSAVTLASTNALSVVFRGCRLDGAVGSTSPTVAIDANVEGVPIMVCYMYLCQVSHPETGRAAIASTSVGGGTMVQSLLKQCTIQGAITYRGSNVDMNLSDCEWTNAGAVSSMELGRWVLVRTRVSDEGEAGLLSWDQGDAEISDSRIRTPVAFTDGSSLNATRTSFRENITATDPSSVRMSFCEVDANTLLLERVTQGVEFLYCEFFLVSGVQVQLGVDNSNIIMQHCNVKVANGGSYALDLSSLTGAYASVNWGVWQCVLQTGSGPAIFVGGGDMQGSLFNNSIRHQDATNFIVSDAGPALNSGGNIIDGPGTGTGTLVYSLVPSI